MTMTQQCHGRAEVEGRSILEERFKEKMTALRTTHDPNRYDPQQKNDDKCNTVCKMKYTKSTKVECNTNSLLQSNHSTLQSKVHRSEDGRAGVTYDRRGGVLH
jgi:hypothetical protein